MGMSVFSTTDLWTFCIFALVFYVLFKKKNSSLQGWEERMKVGFHRSIGNDTIKQTIDKTIARISKKFRYPWKSG